ncbi:hypothetical protein HPB51_014876 [Rhipicephalus microplus]|uniref:Uncharacterized protein n=1 Tax=Rhipicephalus microplus TaxID=6941 RepID=A0A9J6DHE2_RHIMP|nr:hypothetical protein HPB51_014876 [Rhipicephalus microplus]
MSVHAIMYAYIRFRDDNHRAVVEKTDFRNFSPKHKDDFESRWYEVFWHDEVQSSYFKAQVVCLYGKGSVPLGALQFCHLCFATACSFKEKMTRSVTRECPYRRLPRTATARRARVMIANEKRGGIKKWRAENCGRKIDFCGSGISRTRLRGSRRRHHRNDDGGASGSHEVSQSRSAGLDDSRKLSTSSRRQTQRSGISGAVNVALGDTTFASSRLEAAVDGRSSSVDQGSAERDFMALGGTTVALTA